MEWNKIIENKYFMWYSSHVPIKGPHFDGDVKKIGKKFFHSLDELLQINISETTKKKLKSAKPGTKIKIHYLSSNSYICLKRLTDEEFNEILTLIDLKIQLIEIDKKILEYLPVHLYQEKAEIIRKIESQTKFLRTKELPTNE